MEPAQSLLAYRRHAGRRSGFDLASLTTVIATTTAVLLLAERVLFTSDGVTDGRCRGVSVDPAGVAGESERDVQPLQDLLARITWDPEFGKDRYALGYEDRMVPEETVVPFAAVRLDSERPGTFSIEREDGSVVHIPLHRVRTVYRNGEVIWRRPGRAPRG